MDVDGPKTSPNTKRVTQHPRASVSPHVTMCPPPRPWLSGFLTLRGPRGAPTLGGTWFLGESVKTFPMTGARESVNPTDLSQMPPQRQGSLHWVGDTLTAYGPAGTGADLGVWTRRP